MALALLLAGGLATGLQLLLMGRLTPVVMALDSIAAGLLPLGVISLYIRVEPDIRRVAGEEDDESGGGGGGGGGGSDPRDRGRPRPPTGGLDIDWGRFEREFQAYAQRVSRTLEPSRA